MNVTRLDEPFFASVLFDPSDEEVKTDLPLGDPAFDYDFLHPLHTAHTHTIPTSSIAATMTTTTTPITATSASSCNSSSSSVMVPTGSVVHDTLTPTDIKWFLELEEKFQREQKATAAAPLHQSHS